MFFILLLLHNLATLAKATNARMIFVKKQKKKQKGGGGMV